MFFFLYYFFFNGTTRSGTPTQEHMLGLGFSKHVNQLTCSHSTETSLGQSTKPKKSQSTDL